MFRRCVLAVAICGDVAFGQTVQDRYYEITKWESFVVAPGGGKAMSLGFFQTYLQANERSLIWHKNNPNDNRLTDEKKVAQRIYLDRVSDKDLMTLPPPKRGDRTIYRPFELPAKPDSPLRESEPETNSFVSLPKEPEPPKPDPAREAEQDRLNDEKRYLAQEQIDLEAAKERATDTSKYIDRELSRIRGKQDYRSMRERSFRCPNGLTYHACMARPPVCAATQAMKQWLYIEEVNIRLGIDRVKRLTNELVSSWKANNGRQAQYDERYAKYQADLAKFEASKRR